MRIEKTEHNPDDVRQILLHPHARIYCFDHQDFTPGCGRCAYALGCSVAEIAPSDVAVADELARFAELVRAMTHGGLVGSEGVIAQIKHIEGLAHDGTGVQE